MNTTETTSPLFLHGPTVTLRPLSSSDAAPLAAAASESREHYQYTRVPTDVEDAERYIATALAERETRGRIPFAILWHDRIVGSTASLIGSVFVLPALIGLVSPSASPRKGSSVDHRPARADCTRCRLDSGPANFIVRQNRSAARKTRVADLAPASRLVSRRLE